MMSRSWDSRGDCISHQIVAILPAVIIGTLGDVKGR
jgi:hypothetical protein